MSVLQTRFHIQFGRKRTTVSVDNILTSLMAIKLGYLPDDLDAHGAVRQWLQDELVSHLGDDESRKSASQFARQYLIEAISDKKLSRKYDEWLFE